MYIPGIILFLVGSGQVREWLRFHVFGRCLTAKVVSCNHVLKKDGNGREIYNYYNLLVEYVSPDSGHKERCELKTPTQCAVGQQMKMCIGKKDTKPYSIPPVPPGKGINEPIKRTYADAMIHLNAPKLV